MKVTTKNLIQFEYRSDSDGKANKEDDSDTFIEKASDEPIFEIAIVNLSHRKLRKAKVSLLCKGLKFFPTPNTIDK